MFLLKMWFPFPLTWSRGCPNQREFESSFALEEHPRSGYWFRRRSVNNFRRTQKDGWSPRLVDAQDIIQRNQSAKGGAWLVPSLAQASQLQPKGKPSCYCQARRLSSDAMQHKGVAWCCDRYFLRSLVLQLHVSHLLLRHQIYLSFRGLMQVELQ